MTKLTVKVWADDRGNIFRTEIPEAELYKRPWVGLMCGVRVEGDTVIISVKGGNDAARELCGALIKEMEA
jgi:hypothetical protein